MVTLGSQITRIRAAWHKGPLTHELEFGRQPLRFFAVLVLTADYNTNVMVGRQTPSGGSCRPGTPQAPAQRSHEILWPTQVRA